MEIEGRDANRNIFTLAILASLSNFYWRSRIYSQLFFFGVFEFYELFEQNLFEQSKGMFMQAS